MATGVRTISPNNLSDNAVTKGLPVAVPVKSGRISTASLLAKWG